MEKLYIFQSELVEEKKEYGKVKPLIAFYDDPVKLVGITWERVSDQQLNLKDDLPGSKAKNRS